MGYYALKWGCSAEQNTYLTQPEHFFLCRCRCSLFIWSCIVQITVKYLTVFPLFIQQQKLLKIPPLAVGQKCLLFFCVNIHIMHTQHSRTFQKKLVLLGVGYSIGLADSWPRGLYTLHVILRYFIDQVEPHCLTLTVSSLLLWMWRLVFKI